MMHQSAFQLLSDRFRALDPSDAQYATRFVELLLETARALEASDIHLQPTPDGLELRLRIDGVLQPLGVFPSGVAANIVARLKVLADLLTYRTDVPQEGRIRAAGQVEMRVSSFPTLYGEKAVVRLFGGGRLLKLDDLGLPNEITVRLRHLLAETAGAILVTGPAGSGKTTTAYAALRELVASSGSGRSIASLEDPIETAIPGVAQSQVNPAAGFDLATGLRSLMRQDPEVILVGEIRDRATAEIAFQAALTGQLVLSTFHAASATGAISRLSDMGIEPYLLRSGVLAIISQRLVRRLCDCRKPIHDDAALLGLPARQGWTVDGCEQCGGTGYRGRMVLAEMFTADASELGRAILTKSDAAALERLAIAAGMVSRWQRAIAAVELGATSPAEVRRALGFGDALDGRAGLQINEAEHG
ncbi:MAG TPA: GspE/PulE family protein [Pirellulales bacterium]|jgi:type II secretory ATPase GspE/PulE/Tfp pilus assembly ATPase PilB-like protein|nr:GspE/PulE family protein [Pirellulales bacterium]